MSQRKGVDLIGRSVAEAKELLKDEKYRVARCDKSYYVGTRDVNISRFNLEIDDGVVTSVEMG